MVSAPVREAEPKDGSDGASSWKPWYAPVALVFAFVAAIVSGAIVVGIGHSAGASAINPPPSVLDIATVAEELGFVISAVFFASLIVRPRPAQFGLRGVSLSRAAALVILGYVTFIVTSAVWAALLHTSASEKHLVKSIGGQSGTAGVLAACLVTCVVAPICEEFLFRGFMYRALRNWRGPVVSALLTGVMFGAVHVGSAPAVDLVPLGMLGAILCGIYERSGSLFPCIALHALNNSIALGINLGWGWQVPVLFVAAGAAIALILRLVLTYAPGGARARLA
jgi:membrane protease YdiL (CAAX protease family)